MHFQPSNPVIVQADGKVLVEADHKAYEKTREFLTKFAELESSPDSLHTYKITSISLWNAASSGFTAYELIDELNSISKYPMPREVENLIGGTLERYGLVKLVPHPTDEALIRIEFENAYIKGLIVDDLTINDLIVPEGRGRKRTYSISAADRGSFKQRALLADWPVEDLAGFKPGSKLPIKLRGTIKNTNIVFQPREYQWEAARRWYQEGKSSGGHGVIVLACGGGKTIVGITAMHLVQRKTLILATNQASVTQWIDEILTKTTISPKDIGAYTGSSKQIRPITVSTYQMVSHKQSKHGGFEHLHIFDNQDWGLIIYDEVHLLPAPVFGATATLQSMRRLGLTATLIREDGREEDVFTLVGPKRYELPWQDLQKMGFISQIFCHEIHIPLPNELVEKYELASEQDKFRIACSNPVKVEAIEHLLQKHNSDNILIIGTYIDQLEIVSKHLKLPLITGKTPNHARDKLFARFRSGKISTLVVSKVANFSIDLPDANVAIQLSGTFGSRQEEAQRLGRILRPKNLDKGKKKKNSAPKENKAYFYTLVSKDTKEQTFALNRQKFLAGQGYRYILHDYNDFVIDLTMENGK
jgi:DNA excision repair protein ERCC-3